MTPPWPAARQSVVRWRGVRPIARIVASADPGGASLAVARAGAREIDSFMSVPPRSFAPARSTA